LEPFFGFDHSSNERWFYMLMEIKMQTEIEILETRETPCILWA